MSPLEYRTIRQSIGSLSDVAQMLGVDRRTITRRENGELEITKEIALGIKALQVKSALDDCHAALRATLHRSAAEQELRHAIEKTFGCLYT